jgi:hypothetical protein
MLRSLFVSGMALLGDFLWVVGSTQGSVQLLGEGVVSPQDMDGFVLNMDADGTFDRQQKRFDSIEHA